MPRKSKTRCRSVYSHVVVHDYGFAPNPYAGFLSVATCKPQIRRSAHVGDWVVGVGSVKTVGGDRAIYALLIDEIVKIETYGQEERFKDKRPVFGAEPWKRAGDNVYYKNNEANWARRPSLHDASHVSVDLSGKNVLLGCEFYYFGSSAPSLPTQLGTLASPGRGHRRYENPDILIELESWLRTTFTPGILGEPFHQIPRKRITAPQVNARRN